MARASFRLLFAAPAVAILLAGCDIKVDDSGGVSVDVSRGKATDDWVRTYTLPKDGRFEIANQNGEIVVKGTKGTGVKVIAHREVHAGSEEEAQRRLKELKMREDVSADRVVIEAQQEDGEGPRFGRGLNIRWEVEVPDGLAVTFKTMNGPVRLDDVDGRITAATTNGNVVGTGVSGAVQGSSVNGSVSMKLEALSGDVRLQTVNGSVRLEVPPTVDAELDASTVNGGVSVDDKLGLADVSSNRGGFGPATNIRGRLNKGGPRVTLQTTNGGVRVSMPGAGEDDDERGDRRERRERREVNELRGRGGPGF